MSAARRWAAAALLGALACSADPQARTKVLVLGFDGMDPAFVERHAERLPNLMRLGELGGFTELQTVMPPQSPVAWSTVITGMSPAGHGVFDFVHRHPGSIEPFSSMAETVPPAWVMQVGDWVVPLDSGETRPLRRGQAFWEVLEEHDVPSHVIRMPTDFPPLPAADRALSGMGTPDMLGSFGTFQFFTENADDELRKVSGGEIRRVEVVEHRVDAELFGPVNSFRADNPRTRLPFVVRIDPEHPAVHLRIGDAALVLREGDWSDWVQVDFQPIPYLKGAPGIVRFFLKGVRPHFELYASPINVDPFRPEIPISQPDEFAAELARSVGPFYTQGMAEETAGLSAHVIDREDFVVQANLVFDEEIAIYRELLAGFDEGMMFHYFSTTDQAAHMLWGTYEPQLVPIYEKADAVIGHTLDRIDDDTTLLVISDHGFQRFDREVNLNTWLFEEGWLAIENDNPSAAPGFAGVVWDGTKAYAMGLNAIYINRRGRERNGIVEPDEATELAKTIAARLLEYTDPDDGETVVLRVYVTAELFPELDDPHAPDLMVGFAPPYRMAPDAGLGALSSNVVEDNRDEWIGDHCMAHDTVPGVLLSNRPITGDRPSLEDVPVTVLAAFGIAKPQAMVGESFLQRP